MKLYNGVGPLPEQKTICKQDDDILNSYHINVEDIVGKPETHINVDFVS